MMRHQPVKIVIIIAAGAALLAVAGCERSQEMGTKQGTYQGKPDKPAWDGTPWNGNRQDWSVAIDTRAQNQNEYKRIR